MWAFLQLFIESGFPLLGIIFYTMILIAIWRKGEEPDTKKWLWTGIVAGPPVLAVLLWGLLQRFPPVSPEGGTAAGILIIILLVIGIPAWVGRLPLSLEQNVWI